MLLQRCLVLPLFNEDEAVWILGVPMNGVAQTTNFCSRAGNVLSAQSQNFTQVTFFGHHASKYDDHVDSPVQPLILAAYDRCGRLRGVAALWLFGSCRKARFLVERQAVAPCDA